MLTDYSLKMPKEVYGGEHALEKLKDVMSVNDVKKVAVFTDHGIRGTGLLELPMQMLTQAGVETVILDDLPAEPTYSQVQVLVDAFRAEKADIIVAVGGGSCGGAIDEVLAAGCDTLVTADLKYNHFEEAKYRGLNLLDAGHFETENPVCAVLARILREALPELTVLRAQDHKDETQFL